MFFKQLFQLQTASRWGEAAGHGVDAVGFLGVDVGPIFVDDIADAGPRRGDDVGTGQGVESAALGQIADVHAEGARWIGHIDVPVVAAAVDVDVADNRFTGAGGIPTA